MNLDDRIQQAVEAVIQQARSFLETEVRALADHAVASYTAEREAAVAEAAKAKAAEIEEAVRQAREAARAEHEAALAEQKAAAERQQELAVQEARSAALAEAAAALTSIKADSDQALAAARAEAERAVAAAKAEHEEHLVAVNRGHEEQLAAVRAEHERALATAATEHDQVLAAMRAEHDQTLAAAKTEHDEQLAAAKAERDEALAAAMSNADQTLAAATAEHGQALAAMKTEHEQRLTDAQVDAGSRLADAESELAAAEREIASLQDALAAARAEQSSAEKISEAVTEARLGERRADLACSERLLEFARRSDRASSLTEILDSLADYAHAEVGRAALFLVQGAKLRGWRVVGFENVPDEGRGLELDLDATALIARAVHTGHPAATSALVSGTREPGVGTDLPPLLALTAGRAGVAMPVHVGRQVVAVLYTDEGGGEPSRIPSPWPEIVEVATRHAGCCLEALTASKIASVRSGSGAGPMAASRSPHAAASGVSGAGSSPAERALAEEEGARRYARLLVSEIKLYNEAAVSEGKQAQDILARLRPEIDRARRLFEEKFPPATGARVSWFDEELVKTLADGDTSLLGK